MLILFSKIKELEKFLNQEISKSIIDYKIFVRLNIELDVYIVKNIDSDIEQKLNLLVKDFKINILLYDKDDIDNDPFLGHTFTNNANKVEYGLKYRFHSLLDQDNDIFKKEEALPPIVTFYSYKGGMGRTTMLTSYALHLAQVKGRRVVVIDFDLEAPGYLNFFNLSQNPDLLNGEKNGLVEYIIDRKFYNELPKLSNYYIELGGQSSDTEEVYDSNISNYVGDGSVFIFPAGNITTTDNREQYLHALARLDFANESDILSTLQYLFLQITQEIKPDIILIDSRTGFNDIYGIVALHLSAVIVGFFGSSEQTKPGLEFLLDRIADNGIRKEILLINSILPEKQKEKYTSTFNNMLKDIGKDDYQFLPLARIPNLEEVGMYNSKKNFIEDTLVSLVSEQKNSDMEAIFTTLNKYPSINKIFPRKFISNDLLSLRKVILSNLKNDMPKSPAFAEDIVINPSKFYYRESMIEIFHKEKFIIQGFKGTGKTYLYKALKNKNFSEIQTELKKRAINKRIIKDSDDFAFIDIISEKGNDESKLFDFNSLKISEIKEAGYYFKYFWIVYTWNSILLDAKEKLGYDYKSKLQDKIIPINPDLSTVIRFNKIISDPNNLLVIEQDLVKLDTFLVAKNLNLVVLYDQLDNLVKPDDWGLVVSPLVDFWWNNATKYKRFFPKIFIRTDLFNKLKGTNTERLRNNLISIEWSRDEVYAYFFKLVFSNNESKQAFIAYLKKQEIVKTIDFDAIKKQLDANHNQLPIKLPSKFNAIYNRELLHPFMTAFFGEEVMARYSLGTPYDWFYFNLCNADQQTISLRPFISLIAGSIDDARKSESPFPIISYHDYANPLNREEAALAHFRDLTRESDNQDIVKIIDYLKENGNKYKQIFLTKKELYDFLNEVLVYYKKDLENTTVEDLKNLLSANGIIHENPKPNGAVYYFAQLYKYWLGLKSRNPNQANFTSKIITKK